MGEESFTEMLKETKVRIKKKFRDEEIVKKPEQVGAVIEKRHKGTACTPMGIGDERSQHICHGQQLYRAEVTIAFLSASRYIFGWHHEKPKCSLKYMNKSVPVELFPCLQIWSATKGRACWHEWGEVSLRSEETTTLDSVVLRQLVSLSHFSIMLSLWQWKDLYSR